jgi:hypothetical protein|tara:strand:+ start:9410 stop:9589 length:180 start_codon:yes stop_codon:yes gene_type:complete
MASIEELYSKSDFAKVGKSKNDKTPIDLDGGKDLSNEENLAKARGGKLNEKKYSDSVTR